MKKYDDIIELPHKQSDTHSHMSISERAAQFAPFAALVGYNEEISETARLTDRKIELSDEEMNVLNTRLLLLKERLAERPVIRITFFAPDSRKDGGSYQDVFGIVKRIDNYERRILMESGILIPTDDVCLITDGVENQNFFGFLG